MEEAKIGGGNLSYPFHGDGWVMGRICRRCEVLSSSHVGVVLEEENFGLIMEVRYKCRPYAAGGEA